MFPSIKCPKSINRRLDGIVVAGEEKRYCSILTSDEEESLVRYIKNRSQCLQGMNATKVEDVVLNILKTRRRINKQAGRKFKALSSATKTALQKKKVSRSFFLRLCTTYRELKMVPKKVDINRDFNVTQSMAVEYLDDLLVSVSLRMLNEVCGMVRLMQLGLFSTTKCPSSSITGILPTPPPKSLVLLEKGVRHSPSPTGRVSPFTLSPTLQGRHCAHKWFSLVLVWRTRLWTFWVKRGENSLSRVS